VFIAGPENLRSATTRRKAFIAALESWHLSPARTLQGNHKVDGGAQAVRTLLKQPNFPTAILCGNDLTAIGAMQALSDAGIKVPDEVSVVGFDDIDFAHLAYPPLTTINLSREKLGKLAFEALHKILSSKKHQGAEYVMECQLVVRQSTGPARKGPLRLVTPVPGGSGGARP
jgi:DNA-binding LacI/PurR family transcriptional regulator